MIQVWMMEVKWMALVLLPRMKICNKRITAPISLLKMMVLATLTMIVKKKRRSKMLPEYMASTSKIKEPLTVKSSWIQMWSETYQDEVLTIQLAQLWYGSQWVAQMSNKQGIYQDEHSLCILSKRFLSREWAQSANNPLSLLLIMTHKKIK